ncbi:hypothetical protein [Flavobacterium alkalisoli]|uniref:hypothetical protein n=1 Tax=Flavobacterium alkalisoli TaxID=2602769 RepID=UPI003A91DFE3
MKKLLSLISLTCFLSFHITYGQENKIQEIVSVVKNYYSLERENIHVHLNKSIFIANENIWFKGYIYYSKKNTPFFSTTNIFALLKNSENETLESKLLYGSAGSFEGSFELPQNLYSGIYYLQFYTNWMNNFSEDQSAIYKIEVINPNSPGKSTANDTEVKINVYPEGGVFLKNKTNTLGVSVKGCKNQPLPITEVLLYNNNETIQTIPLDKNGFGKFEYYALEEKSTDSLSVILSDKTYTVALPEAQEKGITLKLTNKANSNKTLLELKTNKNTYNEIQNTPIYILIHKDENAFILETKFTDNITDQELVIIDDYLFSGLNTIRILDSNLNEVAQRLLYKDFENSTPVKITQSGKENGDILFSGETAANANLSITVLPSQTKSLSNNSILNDFMLSPYIQNYYDINTFEYFNNDTKPNENLDQYLLCSKSKYKWQSIKQNPPKEKYSFDIGLKIKGVINQNLKEGKSYIVRLTSYDALIEEKTEVINKNEFYFDNLILADSCKLNFELLENGKSITPKLYVNTLNNTSKYNKEYIPEDSTCYSSGNVSSPDDFPDIEKETIRLKEVVIEKKREKLQYANTLGNGQLRGYKITKAESVGFPTVLDLIRYEGYEVRNRPDSAVAVYGRWGHTIKGMKSSPDVYLDNFRLMKLDILRDILTSEVDEFYINKHMSAPTVQNRIGIIKIYRKKQPFNETKERSLFSYTVEDGFEKISPFKNTTYTSGYNGIGFRNYGLIHWLPTIISDENGKFNFSIQLIYKGEVKIIIKGVTPEGKIISEVKTINL